MIRTASGQARQSKVCAISEKEELHDQGEPTYVPLPTEFNAFIVSYEDTAGCNDKTYPSSPISGNLSIGHLTRV